MAGKLGDSQNIVSELCQGRTASQKGTKKKNQTFEGIEERKEKDWLKKKDISKRVAGGGVGDLDGADGEECLLEPLVDEVVEGVDMRAEELAEGRVLLFRRLRCHGRALDGVSLLPSRLFSWPKLKSFRWR